MLNQQRLKIKSKAWELVLVKYIRKHNCPESVAIRKITELQNHRIFVLTDQATPVLIAQMEVLCCNLGPIHENVFLRSTIVLKVKPYGRLQMFFGLIYSTPVGDA